MSDPATSDPSGIEDPTNSETEGVHDEQMDDDLPGSSDPVLGTVGNEGAGEADAVLGDDEAPFDPERLKAESMTTVTNDALAGETVLPGVGEGNDGPTGGSPAEGTPDLPANELAGEDIPGLRVEDPEGPRPVEVSHVEE